MDIDVKDTVNGLTDFVNAGFKEQVLEDYMILKEQKKYRLCVKIVEIKKSYDEKNVIILIYLDFASEN